MHFQVRQSTQPWIGYNRHQLHVTMRKWARATYNSRTQKYSGTDSTTNSCQSRKFSGHSNQTPTKTHARDIPIIVRCLLCIPRLVSLVTNHHPFFSGVLLGVGSSPESGLSEEVMPTSREIGIGVCGKFESWGIKFCSVIRRIARVDQYESRIRELEERRQSFW